jgi:hypothetical protein
MSMGPHDARHQVNDEECTEVDEQKKSGLDLFYLIGIYAIVKLVREYKMGDQSGRPLCCVKDANKLRRKLHKCATVQVAKHSCC